MITQTENSPVAAVIFPSFLLACVSLAVLLSGCALGTTRVEIGHSPLASVPQKRSGKILVRQFSDARPEDHKYIGYKRNGYGMTLGRIGLAQGKSLEALITEYFAEALRQAGYDAVVQAPGDSEKNVSANVILEGDIRTFWLDMYMMTWHHVNVDLRLLDRTGSRVIWQKQIEGDKSHVLWIGITPEFERVIQDALDIALDRAVREFSSEEFQRKVQSGKSVSTLP